MHRTCFWGGDTFAPQLKIRTDDGKTIPVQQFLQDAYLNMWEVVVKTLADLDCVVGFDVGSPCEFDIQQLPHSLLWCGTDDE